jgi:hypothetical protein
VLRRAGDLVHAVAAEAAGASLGRSSAAGGSPAPGLSRAGGSVPPPPPVSNPAALKAARRRILSCPAVHTVRACAPPLSMRPGTLLMPRLLGAVQA